MGIVYAADYVGQPVRCGGCGQPDPPDNEGYSACCGKRLIWPWEADRYPQAVADWARTGETGRMTP